MLSVENDFEDFFADHYETVVRSLTLAVGDRHRAEEAAQTAFERAYRKWGSVAALERPATWIYVVALRDERRRFKRERDAPLLPQKSPENDPNDLVVMALWVHQVLAGLPPRQRAAVVLRHVADLSLAEIADVMRCAIGTVKATLYAAYATLRVELEDEVHTDAS